MIVVADTSPLNYLVLIDAIDVLPELYGQVIVPEAVARELQNRGTPPKTAAWFADRPEWLVIQKAAEHPEDAALEKFGAGEREGILLALGYRPGVVLLIDEGKGRKEATRRDIRVLGTLGIPELAAIEGLIDLWSAVERLLQTSFYIKPSIIILLR